MEGEAAVPIRQRSHVQGVNDELRENQKKGGTNNINLPLHQQQAQEEQPEDQISSTPDSISPVLISSSRTLCSVEHEHCYGPDEKNVFSPPSPFPPTPAPTVSPQPTDDPTDVRTESSSCVSDGQGHHGRGLHR